MTTTAKVSAPRGIDAVYYMMKDIARARRFYEEVLGFTPSSVADSGDWLGAEYELPSGQTFRLGQNVNVPWRESGGGKVQQPFTDTPVCEIAWCEDTEGNTFCLHHRKDGSAG